MANRRSTAGELAQIAIFAALIAALGLPGTFYIGGNAVPITLQTLGVMLAGAILGARKGVLAVLVFELIGLAGLPVFAGGRGGPAVFVGPSAGYIYGWLLGAAAIGALTRAILPRYPLWLGILATAAGGIVVVYACGTFWVAARGLLPLWGALTANGIYLLGDAVKVVVTALVAKQVHRAYPGLMTPAREPAQAPASSRVPR